MKPTEYVLATKYNDGGASDHWCVGFFQQKTWHGRYLVVDGDGNLFRHNGFRRAEPITQEEGEYLLKNCPLMEGTDASIWEVLQEFRQPTVPETWNQPRSPSP